jgi:predicted ATPase
VRRAEQLGFPQGPYNNVYTVEMESVICCEAGQLDRARACVADMIAQSERHGFDFWQLFGAMEQCNVDARILLASADPDPTAVSDQIATMTQTLDMWRGLGVNAYRSEYDCVLARLLTVAGQPEKACARINGELQFGRDTGQRFYEPELLRVRAHTLTDAEARAAGFRAARELARRQGAPLFELRAALDDFQLRGQPARQALVDAAGRLVSDSPLPELALAREILGEQRRPHR